jgi:hypothetical protein
LPAHVAFFPGASFSPGYFFLFIGPRQVPRVHLSSFRGTLFSRFRYRHWSRWAISFDHVILTSSKQSSQTMLRTVSSLIPTPLLPSLLSHIFMLLL